MRLKIIVFIAMFLVSISFVYAAVVSHDSSEINPGTFNSGNYTFGDSIVVTDTVTADSFIGDGSQLSGVSAGNWNITGSYIYPTDLGYYVGIGTETPNQRLFVEGNANITGNLTVGTGTINIDGKNDRIGVGVEATNQIGGSQFNEVIHVSGISYPVFAISRRGAVGLTNRNWTMGLTNNGYFSIQDSDVPAERFTIGTNGYVGIGTITPSSKLQVIGDGNFTGNLTVEGNLTVGTGTLTIDGSTSTISIRPKAPVKVGSAATAATARCVYANGGYLYVGSDSTGDDLEIFDISDPTTPFKVGGVNAADSVRDVQVVGKYAYAVSSYAGDDLEIFDISDPSDPTKVGGINMISTGLATSIYISGRYAYIGVDTNLSIVDISDPTGPVRASTIAADSGVYDVFVSGDYAYVVTENTGDDLEIFDISDPYNPVEVGSVAAGSTQYGVYVSGSWAYGVGNSGLETFNITDPTNPTKVGDLTVGGVPVSIVVAGKYAYTSGGDYGFQHVAISDVSNPANPVFVAGMNVSADAWNMVVSGRYAYVVSGGTGTQLEVLELSGSDYSTSSIGNLEANSIDVRENMRISNDVFISNGLVVGNGLMADGDVSLGTNGSLVIDNQGQVNVTGELNIQSDFWSGSLYADGVSTGTLKVNDVDMYGFTGDLWIGQHTPGALLSCDGSATCVDHGDKMAIRRMEIFNGRLWLGQIGGNLSSCDNTGECVYHGDVNEGNTIYSMAVYGNKLWLGDYNGNLSSCDSSGVCTNHGDKGNSIIAMKVFNGKLWIGAGNIYECDSSGSCTSKATLGENPAVFEVFDGKLWAGTGSGLLYSCDNQGSCANEGDKGDGIGHMAVFNKKLWLGQSGGNVSACDSAGDCIDYGDQGAVGDVGSMQVYDAKLWVGYSLGELRGCNSTGVCTSYGDKGEALYAMKVFSAASLGPLHVLDDKIGVNTTAPSVELHVTGEAKVTGISGDGTGKVVCIKDDGNLGTCSDQPGGAGTCTCA